jgi:hypothetical protein
MADARRDSDMRNPWLKKNPAMSIFLSSTFCIFHLPDGQVITQKIVLVGDEA